MKTLAPRVISTTRSGSYQWAVIESINRGLVTVRLGSTGTGSRLTNLNVVGTTVVGEIVVVDYTTNVPYVRTATMFTADETGLPIAITPLEIPTIKDNLILDPCSLAYGEYCGMTARLSGLNFGIPGYSAGSCGLLPADADSKYASHVIGIGCQPGIVLIHGFINGEWGFDNGLVYLNAGGGMTQQVLDGMNQSIVVLGTTLTPDILYFHPHLDIYTFEPL